MDCYSLNSDVAETLNFLRPPVQRIPRNISTERPYAPTCSRHPNNELLKRDYRTSSTKDTQRPIVEQTSIASSTSLVLKKTTEREIFEQYSESSYTDIQHSNQTQSNLDLPLIKVTVIPNNTAQTQTAKFRKRKHTSKRVQNTVSNQENSIKAKNVYLVVAGRKREKIYEIKTTGSVEFANKIYEKDDHEGAEQVTDLKHLISSLNMDKKKKKGKKKESVHQVSRSSLVNEVFKDADILIPDEDIRPRKSRVRITGRIGLTKDDRYVLRCDATVDNKSIPTMFTPLPQKAYDESDPKSINCRNVKDSNMQAEFKMKKGFNSSTYKRGNSKEIQGKETQSTQTNLNAMCFSNIETLKIFSQNEHTLCTCKKANKNAKHMTEMESEFNSPNTSSPLVIISVYPKQAIMETNEIKSLRDSRNRSSQRSNLSNANSKVRGGKQAVENNFNKHESKSPRTRSPSPDRNSFRARIENNKNEIRTIRTKVTREINNQGATSNFNKPLLSRDGVSLNTKAKASRLISPQSRPTSNKKQHNMNATTLKSQENKGTNTSHMLTKKALVDTYTKKISEHMNQTKAKGWTPENNVSNININVEAENEFYDFLYHQGDLTTDVRFRKTVKDQGSQKDHHIYENMSPSLENFFLSENGGHRKRSFSQTFLFDDQTNDDIAKFSRINVRDSIEISHRREQRNSVNSGLIKPQSDVSIISKESIKQDKNGHFAPIKHYRGDSCSVTDPMQRDKEIRELLGVSKHRPNTSKPEESHDILLIEDHSSVHCFYQVNKQQAVAQVKANRSECSLYECSMHECQCEEETDSDQQKSSHEPSIEKAPDASLEQTTESSDAKDSGPTPEESSESHLQFPQTESPVPQIQHPLYQQLILNRNINVYLQIEQFTKQKPIVLSRKQYDKVKKTIEITSTSAKTRKRPCVCKKYSSLTIGEVRRKSKQKEKETSSKKEESRKLKQGDEKHIDLKSNNNSEKIKKLDKKKDKGNKNVLCQCDEDDNSEVICECKKQKEDICIKCQKRGTDKLKSVSRQKSKNTKRNLSCLYCENENDELNNYCCFCGMENEGKPGKAKACRCPNRISTNSSLHGHAASSVEIRYTSVAYMKHVTFSSTAVETSIPQTRTETKDVNVHRSDSIFTIFKGHRKTPTPNLGTSVYSLYSDYSEAATPRIVIPDPKARGPFPFLKRLMSCLVMRSTRESLSKFDRTAVPKHVSLNSSIDSYHINTSLGAIELSSSIYDTSESFYSDHSIIPINSKSKRGFLSSVRGFLASRRS